MVEEEDFDDSDIQDAVSVIDDILNMNDFPEEGDDEPLDSVSQGLVDYLADKLIGVIGGIAESAGENGMSDQISDYMGNLIVSDMLKKDVVRMASSDEPLSRSDIATLIYLMGNGDSGLDIDKSDEWDDGMIGKYAECLRNYLYTYKPEAKSVDPSIDPNEEHVGPMAQDIEKVAPDCVKETEDGTKVVDGDRLALVNAGVIGDLSRELIEMRGRLAALEAKG